MVNPDISIIDIIYNYPETESVFKKYEKITGTCIMCEHLFETLNEVSLLYKLNIDELLVDLKAVINSYK